MNVNQLAEQALKAMERRTRNNGEKFITFNDNEPEWARDMAHKAHAEFMPDDFRYEFIHDALLFIADEDNGADADNIRDNYSDRDEFVSNPQAVKWLTSNMTRISRVDDYVENCGHGESIINDIIGGYLQEQEETFDLVLSFLADLVNDAD